MMALSMQMFTLNAQNKKSANEILEEVSAKTLSYDNIEVNFNYIMENKSADIHEKTQGMLLVAGDKYRLSIAGPEVICDGKTIWTFFEDSNEVQINEVTEDSGFTPQKLLSNYTKDYIPKREKNVMLGVHAAYSIKLKPKNEDGMVKNAVLLIDKKSKQLLSFIFNDFDGNSFTYNIVSFTPNTKLAQDTFSFDVAKYPDVEVIDMR